VLCATYPRERRRDEPSGVAGTARWQGDMDPSYGARRREPGLRRAHAVVKQRTRLAYAAPELVLLPRTGGEGTACDQCSTLRAARAARQLSIQELARRSRISRSTIHRIESGRTRPRPHVIHALSGALGCAPREIAEFCRLLAAGSAGS
jgi:DNA-binding XRE family transcriptional regulator